jgi:hypothetical protein
MGKNPTERDWLRYALNQSAIPGWITLLSLAFGAGALFDYVLTYLHGTLNEINLIFCVMGVISIIAGAVVYYHEQTTLIENAKQLLKNVIANPVSPPPRIALPDDYKKAGYEIFRGKSGFGFWSPSISVELFEGGLQGVLSGTAAIRGGQFQAPEELRRTVGAKEAIGALRAKKLFRNDQKIRLCSDILLDLGSNSSIELQKTDYLSSCCTNDIAFQKIDVRLTGLEHPNEVRTRELYDGTEYFLTNTRNAATFRRFADSKCSNQIGVSSLALTSDGYLLLVDQLPGGLQSVDKIAPSGSGSLDWTDIPSSWDGTNFWSWLADASCRELREELGLCSDKLPSKFHRQHPDKVAWMKSLKIRTAPIGFGGFLHRSGKPDFFFLSKLSCTLDEVRVNSAYGQEERFLSQRCQVTAARRLTSNNAQGVLNLLALNQDKRDSFPLELCYRMLAYVCVACPDTMEEFLSN